MTAAAHAGLVLLLRPACAACAPRLLPRAGGGGVELARHASGTARGGGGAGGVWRAAAAAAQRALRPEAPAPAEERDGRDAPDLRRLFSLVAPERRLMGAAMAAQLVSAGSTMVFPLALGRIVDTVQGGAGGAGELELLAQGLAGVFTVAGLATATRVTTLSIIGGRISRNLRKDLFESVLRQDTRFFDVRQTGELVNRLSSDVSAMSRTLTDNTAKLLRNGITGCTSLGMVLYLSPKLSLVALGFFPPMIVFGAVFGRVARRLSRELVDALASANQVASERIGGVRTVRLFGAEEAEARRYAKRVDDTFGLGQRVAFADGMFAGGMFYAAQMSLLGVLYVGGGMVLDPAADMTVGVLTSFSLYAVNLGVAVSSVGTAYGQLLKALGSGQRVFEVLDSEPETATSTLSTRLAERGVAAAAGGARVGSALNGGDSGGYGGYGTVDVEKDVGGERLWKPQRAPFIGTLPLRYDATVRFEDVHFSYVKPDVQGGAAPDVATPLLKGVDLTVSPGEILAVAGLSGSGKSTLMTLLSRLYTPTSGRILLGGADVSQLDLAWLRSQVAPVPQDPVLFAGTIASNIRYGMSAHVGMDAVHSAARTAASHDMIMSLRNGYATPVGERGQGLSGGQRARVAIARALVRRPRVLVLDEATAALDAESEVAVASAISNAATRHGLAVLVIAHRISSLRRADRVAVLADGRIAEIGTFEELAAKPNSHLQRMVVASGAVQTSK